jgi:hypothetical protein
MKGILAAAVFLTLALSATSAAQEVPTQADLAITSNSANVRHAKVGDVVTFTVVAHNYGPGAVDVLVYPKLPYWYEQSTGALELFPPVVDCDGDQEGDGAWCEYNVIEPGQSLTQLYFARVRAAGEKWASETACLFSGDFYVDPDPTNDCATATVKIIGKRR